MADDEGAGARLGGPGEKGAEEVDEEAEEEGGGGR
jgi:hypothetical protein